MFYIILATVLRGVTLSDVERALAPARSAYRLAPNAWVINTNEHAMVWHNRLIGFIHPSGRLFISRLDISDRFGWMDEPFWTWLEAEATKNALSRSH